MLLDFFYKLIDVPFRVRNALRRRSHRVHIFSTAEDKSDSQVAFYEDAVDRIVNSERSFNRFRRIYDYREILEHVDYRLGKAYLAVAKSRNAEVFHLLSNSKANDKFGKPRIYKYVGIGKTSPTSLRYIAVASDLANLLKMETQNRIAEIGGGYGGQALVLSQLNLFSSYDIYDLPNVQRLIEKYLRINLITNVSYPSIQAEPKKTYDLVISNYAFSELPRKIQDLYLDKIILGSKRGYMIMNSGLSNKTGRSDGKITLEELRRLIPSIKVCDEMPLTSQDNYLVTWGM